MKKVRKEVNTFKVYIFCDCGGEMIWTGRVLTSHPPQYPHKCLDCGEEYTDYRKYPVYEYDDVVQGS